MKYILNGAAAGILVSLAMIYGMDHLYSMGKTHATERIQYTCDERGVAEINGKRYECKPL